MEEERQGICLIDTELTTQFVNTWEALLQLSYKCLEFPWEEVRDSVLIWLERTGSNYVIYGVELFLWILSSLLGS